jgi:hypothetical protein
MEEIFLLYSDKCALFHFLAFSTDGCLLRKESLHTQSFSKLLTVQPIRYSVWALVRFLNYNRTACFVLEYWIDQACRKVGSSPKTPISLHRCAMIEIVFFDTDSDFAKFIALCPPIKSTIPIRQLYAE